MNKNAPDSAQGKHAVGHTLPPEPVAVASGRAAEGAQRRGLPLELEERGSDVGQQAEPRWGGQALDPHRGPVWADGVGRRQAAGVRPWPTVREPGGLTRFAPAGWGASARPSAPAPPHVGKEHTPQSARKPLNLRTRLTRLVRRTMGCATPITRHDLVLGLFSKRYALGVALSHEINTFATPSNQHQPSVGRSTLAFRKERLKGLSCLKGNFHEQFLGD